MMLLKVPNPRKSQTSQINLFPRNHTKPQSQFSTQQNAHTSPKTQQQISTEIKAMEIRTKTEENSLLKRDANQTIIGAEIRTGFKDHLKGRNFVD